MPRFRRKAGTVDAFRLGQKGQPTPAPEWFGSPDPSLITDEGIILQTPEGNMLARWGDWIVQGVKGEFYPVKNDVFLIIYEPVETP